MPRARSEVQSWQVNRGRLWHPASQYYGGLADTVSGHKPAAHQEMMVLWAGTAAGLRVFRANELNFGVEIGTLD